MPPVDFTDHAPETAAAWERLAEWWDDTIGDGNPTQDALEPVQERLLELRQEDEVLDVACGAGRFTRRLAAAGQRVVAFDHSERFIARATQRTPPELATRIAYRVLDAHDGDALEELGHDRFAAAVCTMGLMDIAVITPLLRALSHLLVPGGPFVFSVTHPAFNSGDAHLVGEEIQRGRKIATEVSAKVTDYTTSRAQSDIGIDGQPVRQPYFHRSLGELLNAFFEHGFSLDRLEELPVAPEGADPRRVSWSNAPALPQVLVARVRPR